MFCRNCGKEIDDKASFCIHCGVAVDSRREESQTNVLAIVGFVLSFFVAIAGLICSIIGYKNAPDFGGKGKSLALAGIIISIVSMITGFVLYLFAFSMFGAILGTL